MLKEIGGGNSMNTEGVGLKGVGSAVFVDKCVQTIQVFESDEEWIGSEQGASDREADLMAKEAEQLLKQGQQEGAQMRRLTQQQPQQQGRQLRRLPRHQETELRRPQSDSA